MPALSHFPQIRASVARKQKVAILRCEKVNSHAKTPHGHNGSCRILYLNFVTNNWLLYITIMEGTKVSFLACKVLPMCNVLTLYLINTFLISVMCKTL